MTTIPLGATHEEWRHFSEILGLTQDLLPVVCRLDAKISPGSSLTQLGKVPSVYSPEGYAIGISKWPTKIAIPSDIALWARSPDYGICLQTRNIRAIDVDVDDPDVAASVRALLTDLCIAVRFREGSSRFLILVRVPGPQTGKPVIKLQQGSIEFLGDGQHCVVIGVHKSGQRYKWAGGLPRAIPTITAEEYKSLQHNIRLTLGVEDEKKLNTTKINRAESVKRATDNDPVAEYLFDNGWVLSDTKTGQLNIRCPFEEEHSQKNTGSSTSYFVRNTHGYADGHFKCLHAHCAHRTDQQYIIAVGFSTGLVFDEVDEGAQSAQPKQSNAPVPNKVARLATQKIERFLDAPPTKWLIKNLIPEKGLVVIYGQPGSGKTFFTLDLAGAIAQGKEWRGLKVIPGRVVYVCAEGIGGFRNRLKAYLASEYLTTADFQRLEIIADQPNILEIEDVRGIIKNIGKASLIVLDTFASIFQGDENDGRDMTRAIRHCQKISEITGAATILVHHTPKSGTGARGHSALKGAADIEIEVTEIIDGCRGALVTKSKDGPSGMDYGFRLDTTTVGADEDGEVITSCVVAVTDPPDRTVRLKSKKEKPSSTFSIDGFPEQDLTQY